MARVAVVTGGASGIGRALGAALVRRGDQVVLADVDGDAATAVAERLTSEGPGTASALPVDVRDAAAVAAVVAETVQRHGRLDLMVNNAGIGIGGNVEELAVGHWDRAIGHPPRRWPACSRPPGQRPTAPRSGRWSGCR
jgi:NAD(P)-dependent dehydrogenase (short-subunit alcohol dehydrogenase family)